MKCEICGLGREPEGKRNKGKIMTWLYDFLEEQGVHVKNQYLHDSADELLTLILHTQEPVRR